MTNKKTYLTFLSVIILLLISACSDEKKKMDKKGTPSTAVTKIIEKKIEPQTDNKQITDKKESTIVSEEKNSGLIDKSAPKTDVQAQVTEISKQPDQEKKIENKIDNSSLDKEFDPTGKLNPFLPFVSDESGQAAEKTDNQKRKREPLTPLEKIDIAQLKLTAITRTSSGNIALVEEASGKGYVLNEGTYIGLNSGKVISVLSDKVIIEEEIENILGKVSIQERELKLQKPTGE